MKLEVAPGKLLFVHMDDIHQDIFNEGIKFYCITFSIKNSAHVSENCRIFKKTIKPSSQILDMTANKTFWTLCHLLNIEAAKDGTFAYDIINGLFYILLQFKKSALKQAFHTEV